MDITAVMHEIDRWPVEDSISLLERMWDRLIDDGYAPEMTKAQRVELDLRIEEMEQGTGNSIPMDVVRANLDRPA